MTGRLIEADKLIQRLRNDPLFESIEQFGVIGVIEAEPTVDAIPVEQWKLHPIDFETFSEPQWIPVSKKLPNKKDYVIVTTKCGEVIEAQFEVWNSGVKEWWIDNDNTLEFDDVVAWMELPKPYRGG
jgi:hypothetical protein